MGWKTVGFRRKLSCFSFAHMVAIKRKYVHAKNLDMCNSFCYDNGSSIHLGY